MTPQALKLARQRRGWTQTQAARKLGLSQPYLSMLERGERPFPHRLVHKAKKLFRLPPTVLPPAALSERSEEPDNQVLAERLAQLGYPGFTYLRGRRQAKNPAEVLLFALAQEDLEARLVEALPWLLLRYAEDLDTSWLVQQARLHNLQNRLGFVVSLTRRAPEESPQLHHRAHVLKQLEQQLEESRLVKEDTLCQASMPAAKRQWLVDNRPERAAHWHLLTDWQPEHLRYVA